MPSGEAGCTGASGSTLSTRIGSAPVNVPPGQPVTVVSSWPTGSRSWVNVAPLPAGFAEVHGAVEPFGPAKQMASCTVAGPLTETEMPPIGTVQPGPMTFQYSSSPECWVLAGLSQPSTVNCTW